MTSTSPQIIRCKDEDVEALVRRIRMELCVRDIVDVQLDTQSHYDRALLKPYQLELWRALEKNNIVVSSASPTYMTVRVSKTLPPWWVTVVMPSKTSSYLT